MTEATGVGAELRQAREAQGLAIVDVAQQLKFAPRQIESLEAERFERLPGPTIARGMVRNYARLLKLDPEPLVERMAPYVAPADPEELAARFKKPVPFSDNTRRSTLVYAGFSAAVLLLVAFLAYEWQQERGAPQFVAPAATAQVEAPPPVEAQATEPPAPNPIRPTAAAKPLAEVVSRPPAPPAEENPEPQPEPRAEPAAEAPVPQVAAVEAKPETATPEPPPAGGLHRIVLVCEEEAWLEVRDVEGRALISSLNPAGTERAVRGRAPFSLVIGNAHHVKLYYDGKPVDLQPHIRVEVARLTLP